MSPHALIDCDVHSNIPPAELARRLPARWRRVVEDFGLRAVKSNAYVPTRPRAAASRTDTWPPGGGAPGSDMPFVREQLLDRWGVDVAILNPIDALDYAAQVPALSEHLFRALNDWTREAWLDADPRFRSTMTVPFEYGSMAVREIERLASDDRFVSVMLVVAPREPLGHRRYWDVYEAAAGLDLPVVVHVGGIGNSTVTGAGWYSFYFEDHMAGAHAMATQLMSLVCQGVFDRFPTLKVVLEEGGLAWAPPLMWALDSAWSQLRHEVPHLDRRPSEIVREHFWFTTQPIDEPDDPAH
ncbi:MAG TPA: amidohydrolase family protein, partial [Solirubrobacteraceae bacterium]|nr:amidohydrolase family protein [Solirubrobacteraceae bacterium]